ncbi:tyrosine-type recombinase/integrase [Bradyrhizobium canariense]|uniref:tyrosine-type recombinase/integrase n=1 Tax=Bradyrhizobium canariense TaxID=255045 RepID=UPI0018E96B47|nr:tyrosine-type recombinase/integrase [Bradyrhizobium canariense]
MGFAYLLKQYAATAARGRSGLVKKRISPHVLWHTCAMIILQATQDIRKASLWLGHATLTTTELYTRGDTTEKLDAMESIVPPHLRRGAFQPSDTLIALPKRSLYSEANWPPRTQGAIKSPPALHQWICT